jgi:hypothetical protein
LNVAKESVGVMNNALNKLLTHMKKYLFFILLLRSVVLMACECPPLAPISKELASDYDIVFMGKVDSVSAAANGISSAYFTVEEFYKGHAGKHIIVDFDAVSACMMSFAKNEHWIIYATYQRFDVISVKLCSHSRKQVNASEQDFYATAAQRTFEQESEFLKTAFGVQPFIEKEAWNKEQQDLKPRNEQPSGMSKMVLVLISFGAMILIYILTRKKKRKNGE